jgi:hypothetical protein
MECLVCVVVVEELIERRAVKQLELQCARGPAASLEVWIANNIRHRQTGVTLAVCEPHMMYTLHTHISHHASRM